MSYHQSPPYVRVRTSIVLRSLHADWLNLVTWLIAAIFVPTSFFHTSNISSVFTDFRLDMVFCCAFGCNNRSCDGYKMYSIPSGERNADRRKKWLCAIKRENFNPKTARLCEANRHFHCFVSFCLNLIIITPILHK